MKRYLATGLVLLVLASGCGIDRQSVRVGHLPLCDHTNTGRLILMAQSVPTAQLIPCITRLPAGWELEHANTESGRSQLQFENAAGAEVVIELLATCSPVGIITGSEPGIDSFTVTDDTGRVDEWVFDGGCIRIEAPLGAEPGLMADAVSFTTRETLRVESGWEL